MDGISVEKEIMRTKTSILFTFATALAATLCTRSASAQPDVRMIRPNIMVLLDSSGSMEFRMNGRDDAGECARDDGGECINCTTGVPQCSASCPEAASRNRWITALEVLTGTIEGYTCQQMLRNDSSQYDYRYQIPHHLPLSYGHQLFEAGASQRNDGIFDVYADRVRFGLMTGDFEELPAANMSGMYSYANPFPFRPRGCATSEIWNYGARRASADENYLDVVPGGLVSVGAPGADTTEHERINGMVQQALVGRNAFGLRPTVPGVRPIGATPINALLDDAYYYWTNNTHVTSGTSGDPYFQCRNRANILITDGAPTDNHWLNECSGGGDCPYDLSSAITLRMSAVGPTSPGVKTFVVAFNESNPSVDVALRPIAIAGNTARVYYANDRPSFASALSTILDTVASSTSTRVPPVFGTAGSPSLVGTPQYQFTASFTISPGLPWSGNIQRQRTECEASSMGAPPVPTPREISLAAGDDFGYNLNPGYRAAQPGWGSRYLWTYIPTGTTSGTALRAVISDGVAPGLGYVHNLESLTSSPTLFDYSTTSQADTLLAWLRGDAGTVRETRPLGDVYRSTPTIVAAPQIDLPDTSFTAFRSKILSATTAASSSNAIPSRRRAEVRVGTREPVMYVGSNDGILHAFNTDNGEEIWGFVPPFLLSSLKLRYPNTRSAGVDGTPVVKDVLFERAYGTAPNANSWHSVLVVGLRGGGPAYVALDVTDPYQPKFLWQFTDAYMSAATATPAIGTLYFRPTAGATPVERAVAFIPGGAGENLACSDGTNTRPTRNPILGAPDDGRGARRASTKCWATNTGQFLYVVDLETGELIRRLGSGSPTTVAVSTPRGTRTRYLDSLPTKSPMTGAPALYNGVTGTVAIRAFLGDADGTLWRADFSSPDPSEWWMSDEYDLYWGEGYDRGQPIIEKPTITLGARGDVNIAFASGDPDQLTDVDSTYRAASITESTASDSSGTLVGVSIHENWQIRPGLDATRNFMPGERMTGAMTMFNGVLYFGSFVPRSTTDPCDYGYARLWGLDMTRSDGGTSYDYPFSRLDMDGDPATTSDLVRNTRDLNFNGDSGTDDINTLLFGVTVSRQMNCNVTASATDPLTGMPRTYVASSTGGEYRLVLQTAQGGRTGTGGVNPVVARRLPRPQMNARIESWAAIFE
jgi:type IV pilus assembly protein PilY1